MIGNKNMLGAGGERIFKNDSGAKFQINNANQVPGVVWVASIRSPHLGLQ